MFYCISCQITNSLIQNEPKERLETNELQDKPPQTTMSPPPPFYVCMLPNVTSPKTPRKIQPNKQKGTPVGIQRFRRTDLPGRERQNKTFVTIMPSFTKDAPADWYMVIPTDEDSKDPVCKLNF